MMTDTFKKVPEVRGLTKYAAERSRLQSAGQARTLSCKRTVQRFKYQDESSARTKICSALRGPGSGRLFAGWLSTELNAET